MKVRFYKEEIRDLVKAWLAISFAFAVLLSGAQFNINFLFSFSAAALTVGLGFICHELMHKYVAQKFGLRAFFASFDNMLFLAILFSFFGFIIAAPGAVMIQGALTEARNGKISAAGPATNLLVALAFLPLTAFSGFLGLIGMYGFTINSWLALFNMIPFGNFDGIKVLRWNKLAYAAITITAIFLVFGKGLFLA